MQSIKEAVLTYKELLDFLLELKASNDERLHDTVVVYNSQDGEYYPADVVEFNGDDILSDGHLFIMAVDWGTKLAD